MSSHISNVRPKPDQVLTDIVDYVTRYQIKSKVAYDTARVMCVSVHPYVSGAAHRIGLFEEMLAWLKSHQSVVFMTGAQIYDWYKAQQPSGA